MSQRMKRTTTRHREGLGKGLSKEATDQLGDFQRLFNAGQMAGTFYDVAHEVKIFCELSQQLAE